MKISSLILTFLLCGTCLANNYPEDIIYDRCDIIELNHFYSNEGREVFQQIIFWEFNTIQSTYLVKDWQLYKGINQCPTYNYKTKKYEMKCIFMSTHRHIVANSFMETWTQHDRELKNREMLPKMNRPGLSYPNERFIEPE